MKKLIVALSLLFVPLFASASIDANLYYGINNKAEVTELQEFLIDKGFLTGTATGNFYSLTLKAVKAYQASVNLPKSGYVGTLTRKSINDTLLADLSDYDNEAVAETGSVPVPVTNSINRSGVDNSGANNVRTPEQIRKEQITQDTTPVTITTSQIPTSTVVPIPTPQPVVPSVKCERDFTYGLVCSNPTSETVNISNISLIPLVISNSGADYWGSLMCKILNDSTSTYALSNGLLNHDSFYIPSITKEIPFTGYFKPNNFDFPVNILISANSSITFNSSCEPKRDWYRVQSLKVTIDGKTYGY